MQKQLGQSGGMFLQKILEVLSFPGQFWGYLGHTVALNQEYFDRAFSTNLGVV